MYVDKVVVGGGADDTEESQGTLTWKVSRICSNIRHISDILHLAFECIYQLQTRGLAVCFYTIKMGA